jgi:site-specific DNA-methyltransferase (adenine-specific)
MQQHPLNLPDPLVCGDCLAVLAELPPATFHLIYLDPPFNTNLRRTAPRGRRSSIQTQDSAATYADSFGSAAAYIDYLRPRVAQLRRVLAPHGSLFFHCDWRMSHHVRLLLDEVFGVEKAGKAGADADAGVFVNEIIWHYGLGAARAQRHLLTKHDVIFWYAASRDYTFNVIRSAPTQAMQNKYRHVDEQGNRYMNSYGKRYVMRGGKPLDDVWDIPAIAPTSAERCGYPTQKPLALLERIVALASQPGDGVLDPFCGSGTALVAAQRLGRRWLGIDANPQAVAMARARLEGERG